jgi:hypothetical protein
MNLDVKHIVLADARRLAYCAFGAPADGAVARMLYFHGNPSCCMEAWALAKDAEALGVAVTAFDRSGIGKGWGRSALVKHRIGCQGS